ncbi:MAG: hypothetical protein ACYTKD_15950 [Planctomycetota bacterium]|jgi:hypothetical protein
MRKWLAASSAVLLAAAARGQIKVMDSEDVVKLVSGEEIKGKVLGSGLKAVVIVVKGEEDALVEKTIPREQVESVTRGGASPTMTTYATETIEGVRVVTGESQGGEGEVEDGGEPAGGPKPKAGAKGAKGGGKRPARGGRATPKISKQQLEKLMQTNPGIERMVKAAGGPDKAMSLLQQQGGNPQMAKFLQQFLKSGKLPAGLPKR